MRTISLLSTVPVVLVGSVLAPPSTSAATTTPGAAVPISIEVGSGPDFEATALLRPTASYPWLLIGNYRSAPGAVNQGVVYTAPAESPSSWQLTAATGEETTTWVNAAVSTADGQALLLGGIEDGTGIRPISWAFDGTSLTPQEIESVGASPGTVREATASPDGGVFAVVERSNPDGTFTYDVARRNADSSWTMSALAGADPSVDFSGIAVNGATVVVTGVIFPSGAPGARTQAHALRSTDGGATFAAADASTLASASFDTALEQVVAHPGGFYAAACVERGDARRPALASSADGARWDVVPVALEPVESTLGSAHCSDISVDDEGGVWLVGTRFYDTTFFRVNGTTVDRVAIRYSDGERFGGDSLVAVGAGTVATVIPSVGGVHASFTPAVGTAFPPGLPTLQDAAGPVESHETASRAEVIDDQGLVVAVSTYPFTILDDDGFRTAVRSHPYSLDDAGTTVADPSLAPVEAETNSALTGLVTLADGQVSVSTAIDPPGGAEYSGALGDIVVSRRQHDGSWSPTEVLVGGLGQQQLAASAGINGGIIFVGWNYVTDQSTGVLTGSPLAYVGDSTGTTFAPVAIPIDSNDAWAGGVCAMPDGRGLVIGRDDEAATSFTALVETATQTATVNAITIDPAGTQPTTCQSAPDGALVTADLPDGRSTLYRTADGITFTPVDVLEPSDSLASIRGNQFGVAVVGTTGPFYTDGFVLFGPSIDSLQRIEVPALVGPGQQLPTDVVVRDGTILVLGMLNGAAVVWPVAIA